MFISDTKILLLNKKKHSPIGIGLTTSSPNFKYDDFRTKNIFYYRKLICTTFFLLILHLYFFRV